VLNYPAPLREKFRKIPILDNFAYRCNNFNCWQIVQKFNLHADLLKTDCLFNYFDLRKGIHIKLSFTAKLVLGISAWSLLGLITIYIIANTVVHNIIYENIAVIAQREQTINAAEIDAWFGAAKKTLTTVTAVIGAMETDRYFAHILERLVTEYDFIDNAFIGFMDGTSINGLRWIPPYDWTLLDRPWFIAALETGEGEVAILDAFWSHSGQVVAAALSTYLPGLGGTGAVIVFSITLEHVLDRISDFPVMGGGYLILIGKDGQIIAHPEPYYTLGPIIQVSNLRDIHGGSFIMNAISTGVYRAQINDARVGPSHFMAVPLESVNWVLISIIPTEATQALVSGSLRIIMITFGLFLIVLLATMMFIVTFLTRSMEKRQSSEERRLQSANKAKRMFLSKMSHEIRTPMNAVIGMTELALREKDPNAIRNHIFAIKQAGTNLLSIINDILDFTKIESGKMEINPGYYQFSSLVNDVISIIRMRTVGSRLRFAVNIDSGIPNELYGDATKIRQVLINLLDNAVKYTEKGYVTFSARGEMLDARTINLIIDVKDSGRGIKKENLNNLFADFSQFDTTKNKNIEGTGLGLAITWSILKAMDGDIQVSSEYGKGSTFTITLPQKFRLREILAHVQNPEKKDVLMYERRELYTNFIAATLNNLGVSCEVASNYSEFHTCITKKTYSFIFIANALYKQYKTMISKFETTSKIILLTEFGETAASKDNRPSLAMPAHCISIANVLNGFSEDYSYKEENKLPRNFTAPNAKVLIVDDIKTNLIVTEGLLLPYQMQVDLCKSGAEAIEAVQARQYDLVFMDHWMPEMDGVEATKRIRLLGDEGSYYKNVPIIALTANAISGTWDMFMENGLNGFLAKPIDTGSLGSILEKWIPKEKIKVAMPHENEDAPGEKPQDGLPPEGIEIKGLDTGKGIAMSGGSIERYAGTLDVFYYDGLEKMEQLKRCLEAGNIPLYAIHIHALKIAAANIGAAELSNSANDLEAAGKVPDLDFIEAHTPRFLTALKSLLGEIQAGLLSRRENEEKAILPTDTELLKAMLAEIKQALETLDVQVMDSAIDTLLDMNLNEKAAAVQNIARNILIADYDKALTLTESLLKELQ